MDRDLRRSKGRGEEEGFEAAKSRMRGQVILKPPVLASAWMVVVVVVVRMRYQIQDMLTVFDLEKEGCGEIEINDDEKDSFDKDFSLLNDLLL